MTRLMTVTDSIVIRADRRALYDAVSDLRRMGEWSPENLGGHYESAQPADVGTVFVGDNRRGRLRWSTRCVVTAAEPGRRFAFDVNALRFVGPFVPVPIAAWEYRFEPTPEGTRVSETWTDHRRHWPDLATRIVDPIATRHPSFADYQRGNIARTLARLRDAFDGRS